MNVLFVTNSIGYGGAEKMMNFVTNCLSESGHKVIILNLNTDPTCAYEWPQIFNSNVIVITLDKCYRNKHIYRIRHIISVVNEYCIDIIIAFTMFPNFYSKIASFFTNIPSVMSERGDPNMTFSKSIKDKIIYYVINLSKGAVFQTNEASLFYKKGLRKRGTIIPNPIFIDNSVLSLDFGGKRKKTIVSVGRFQNKQKRYDVMLRAFSLFYKTHPDYILRLYGSGEDEVLIKKIIKELDLLDCVEIMGAVKDPIRYIYADGIFVMTSDYEGIPNALLEAMAIGLPVVSTDCTPGGARMLIKNNINGQIVPKGDIVALERALSRFADDEDFANICGENAKNVLIDFAPTKIKQSWISYITNIAKKQ